MQTSSFFCNFSQNKRFALVVSVLAIFTIFFNIERVFGSELPFGTVAVCEEDASSGLFKNEGRWQHAQLPQETYVFKKVPLEGAYDRDRYSGCPNDLRGEKDSYWDNGMPEILYRCYQFKSTRSTNPSERGCYEFYSKKGDLQSVTCDWGFVFHPEKDLFKFPNYAIFQITNEEYAPKMFGVSHGNCSKM